jgi:hypothetical protein
MALLQVHDKHCQIHPVVCFAEPSQPKWKVDLAALKTAVGENAQPDVRLEEPDPSFLEKERVYLVGIQVKSALADTNHFSGVSLTLPLTLTERKSKSPSSSNV